MNKVYLTGYIDVPESKYDEVKEALKTHITLTENEKGCEKFSVTPSLYVPCRFDVSEIFSTRESFDNHQKRVKNSQWGALTSTFKRNYKIEEK